MCEFLFSLFGFFFFKQKTAYEMRISDWSSDVCSSDLYFSEIPDRRQIHVGAVGVSPSSSEVDADTLSTPPAVDESDERAAQPQPADGFFLYAQQSSRLRESVRIVLTNAPMPPATHWFVRAVRTVTYPTTKVLYFSKRGKSH